MSVGLVALTAATAACSPPAPSGSAPSTTAWNMPAQVEPAATSDDASVYGVSCPTDRFCAAVDESGSALYWQGTKWSNPQPVHAGGTLTSVSCPTSTQCVAISAGGTSSAYDGQSWSPALTVGPAGTYRISCPTIHFCAAVGDSGTQGGPNTVGTFDGTSWSTSVIPSSPGRSQASSAAVSDRLFDVSCPTSRFCVAIDLDGSALIYDGTTWSRTRGPAMRGATSVSCPASSFCMSVGPSDYSTFDGKDWSKPTSISGFESSFVPDVSCASNGSCRAVGLNGESSEWRGGAWSTPTSVFGGEFLATVSISCATSRFCMAVNSRGTAAHT